MSANTRRYHITHMERLRPLAEFPAEQMTRAHVLRLRDRLAARPRTADLFVAVVRRLWSYGTDRGLVTHNPAMRIAKLDTAPTSYEAWSEEERRRFIESFAGRSGAGPNAALLTAFMLACYASPRRGDILRLTAADYDGELLVVHVSKTRKRGVAELAIPVAEPLRRHLDGLGIEVGLLVPGPRGKTWEPSEFSRAFREHCDGIGLPGRHLHGLRHTCATALAEAGCSEEEIMAVTGHTTSAMVKRYTAKASQRKLARSAIAKMQGRG